MKISEYMIVNNSFFCNEETIRGVVVERKDDSAFEEVVVGQNKGEVVGILLNDIVNIDLGKIPLRIWDSQKTPGSKVEILQQGIILIKFKKRMKIGTLLFYNKKGKLTKKPQLNQKPIASVLNSDDDGWTKVYFRWCGI